MPTDAQRSEETIDQWMSAIASDGGVLRLDDLHIDQINPAWKDRNQWIEGGLEAFRIATGVRDRCQMPFVVGLGFSLGSGDQPRGVDFRAREELRAKLDWSPPSLYLFERGEEPHTQTAYASVLRLDPAVLGTDADVVCYYLEFRQQESGDYCRTVFVEG